MQLRVEDLLEMLAFDALEQEILTCVCTISLVKI